MKSSRLFSRRQNKRPEHVPDKEWDYFWNCPMGSVARMEIIRWGIDVFSGIGMDLPLKRQLKKGWSAMIQGVQYPELWLRYYAIMRFYRECMVMCSDFANIATNLELPIVRDRKFDVELLLAHARIQQWVLSKKKQKQQQRTEHGSRISRRAIKEMARTQ